MSEKEQLLEEYERSKPEDTDFRQQRLRSWQPLLIPKFVVLTFFCLGCVFFPVGFVVWRASDTVHELSQRYDNIPCDTDTTKYTDCIKTVPITLKENMDKPIYFYYELTDFFQNHRRYVKSRADDQIHDTSNPTLSTCDPLEKNGNLTLYPCGLISASVFNDTFEATVTPVNTDTPEIITEWIEKGISWDVDRNYKFVEAYPNNENFPYDKLTRQGPYGTMPELNDEHLMNWMRTAAFSDFKKLYAIINRKLYKGDIINVSIYDQFDNSYGGHKSIFISTASWIGGKNPVLAYLYIGVGAFCFLMMICVFLKQMLKPRKLGDMANVADLHKLQSQNANEQDNTANNSARPSTQYGAPLLE